MRIIAGKYRHLEIKQPPLEITRPTKDRVREAVFSSLGPAVTSRVVLDLFSGSGAYGLEALSRGAQMVTFVDNQPEVHQIIEENLLKLRVPSKMFELVRQTINEFLSLNRVYSLVFIDPPYNYQEYSQLISFLEAKQLLSPDVIIIIESNKSLRNLFHKYSLKEYKYGLTYILKLWRTE